MSAVFGYEKCEIIRLIHNSKEIQSCCAALADATASPAQVASAESQIFVSMYEGKPSNTLNSLRYINYIQYTATSTKKLQPRKLPPTEKSALFHSLHLHLQAMIWKTLGHCQIDPCSWVCEMKSGTLVPVLINLDPAPEKLLSFVHCKCKIPSKSPCRTNICFCWKHGFTCITFSNCRDTDCNISLALQEEDEQKDDSNLFEHLFCVIYIFLFAIFGGGIGNISILVCGIL